MVCVNLMNSSYNMYWPNQNTIWLNSSISLYTVKPAAIYRTLVAIGMKSFGSELKNYWWVQVLFGSEWFKGTGTNEKILGVNWKLDWKKQSAGLMRHVRECGWREMKRSLSTNDDIIKWKHFPRCWAFVRGIHRWIPSTKASEEELWCFRWSAPEWAVK